MTEAEKHDREEEGGEPQADEAEAPAAAPPADDEPADGEPPPPKKKAAAPGAKKGAPEPKKGAPKKGSPKKKEPAPAPPPPKGRTLLYVAVGVVAIAGVTAYQTGKANDEARARVEAACKKFKPLEEARLSRMKEAAHTFMGEDAGKIELVIDNAKVAPVCDQLPAQLTGLTWNFGKRWEPPKDPNAKPAPTAEELHDMMLRAKPRCEAKVLQMLSMLDSLGEDTVPEETKASALAICDPETFREEVNDKPKADWPPTLLEGWPKYLEGYATSLAQAEAPPAPPTDQPAPQ